MNGKLDISYTDIGKKSAIGLAFYSVDQYGEEYLIDSYFCKAGDDPVDVNVDLTGVEILKIVRVPSDDESWPYDHSIFKSDCRAELYNVTLTAY